MHHMDSNKAYREKGKWELHKNAKNYNEKILEAKPRETAAVRQLKSYL